MKLARQIGRYLSRWDIYKQTQREKEKYRKTCSFWRAHCKQLYCCCAGSASEFLRSRFREREKLKFNFTWFWNHIAVISQGRVDPTHKKCTRRITDCFPRTLFQIFYALGEAIRSRFARLMNLLVHVVGLVSGALMGAGDPSGIVKSV